MNKRTFALLLKAFSAFLTSLSALSRFFCSALAYRAMIFSSFFTPRSLYTEAEDVEVISERDEIEDMADTGKREDGGADETFKMKFDSI